MQKGLGIAALVIAITSIFIPIIGPRLTILSAGLAAFAFGTGFAFGLSSIIINAINIFLMSPSVWVGEKITTFADFETSPGTILLYIQAASLALLMYLHSKRRDPNTLDEVNDIPSLQQSTAPPNTRAFELPKIYIQKLNWLNPAALTNSAVKIKATVFVALSGIGIWVFMNAGDNKYNEAIKKEFESKFVQCGDSWYGQGGTQSFNGVGLLELKNPSLDVVSRKLSKSDEANGFQFEGNVHVKVELYREYIFNENKWGVWREATNEAIGGLPLFGGGGWSGFLQLTQSPGVFPVTIRNGKYSWPASFTNAKKPTFDCSDLQQEVIGKSIPKAEQTGISVEPLFTSPSPPALTNKIPSIPTLQFATTGNDGWVKRQDIDLWVRPGPPYSSPPQTLEAKGAWLLYNAEPINFKVKQRVPVYKTPDTNSIDYYLEPGQSGQIYEGYEKSIRPGVSRLKKDWKDPDTGATYKAGEDINFYTYQEGGCYWFSYSSKTNGQFGDGYCPLNGGEEADVNEGENIRFLKFRGTPSANQEGWIKSTEDLWQGILEANYEPDTQQTSYPDDKNIAVSIDRSSSIQETTQLLTNPVLESKAQSDMIQKSSDSSALVMQLVNIAARDAGIGHEPEIQSIKQQLDALPKPVKGQKKSARNLNDQALSLLNNGQLDAAVQTFRIANQLDKSDPEIIHNLGYVLLMQESYDQAEMALVEALTISPGRSTAWQSLGDVLAAKNDIPKAVAAYENSYRFSKNRVKTHKSIQKFNANEDRPALKNTRQIAMDWAEKVFVDENLQEVKAFQNP